MPEYSPAELIQKWEEFFDAFDYAGRILSVADAYPETRSLEVRFDELNRFDTDFAIYLLSRPANVIAAGEEAITRVAPPGEEPMKVHLRVKGLPRDARIMVGDLRAEHLGRFITVEGLVRKATEVRPKVVDAQFQCLRCSATIKEVQEGQAFREPLECYKDQGGCERTAASTKFKLLGEASQYLDTQKIEIQEPPEILRGGEEPQRLEGYIEDDITGQISPGERIVLNGILRSAQRGRPGAKSTIFDIFVEINSAEKERVEFEEIEITSVEAEKIREEAARPGIVDRIVQSIAPAIYGLEKEKEALALQLFGGVAKVLPDGTRIRGDSHLLLVGDPGCLVGDERVFLSDGTIKKIEDLGKHHLQPINRLVRLGVSMGLNARAIRFHRYEDQPTMEVVTESGKSIRGTFNHPLLVWNPPRRVSRKGDVRREWRRLDELRVGDELCIASSVRCTKQSLAETGWVDPGPRYPRIRTCAYVDETLAAIMGYILGDGNVGTTAITYYVARGEFDLIPRLRRCFREAFRIEPSELPSESWGRVFKVNSTAVARWLAHLRTKRVPDEILASRNSVVAAFLRWLFDADGCCFSKGRGRSAVQLRSSEIELLRDVQALLLRWG
ncbi:MAG: LAGLIDADG family homing endonuclease, partial [Candidatus Thermoplasmatota archaeon]